MSGQRQSWVGFGDVGLSMPPLPAPAGGVQALPPARGSWIVRTAVEELKESVCAESGHTSSELCDVA